MRHPIPIVNALEGEKSLQNRHEMGVPLCSAAPLSVLLPKLQGSSGDTSSARGNSLGLRWFEFDPLVPTYSRTTGQFLSFREA